MRSISDQYGAPENRLTHALGCCLDRDRRLLRAFIRWAERRAEKPAPSGLAAREDPAHSKPDEAEAWPGIPNEPVTLDEFMAKYCEKRSRSTRRYQRKALLAAARNGTVSLPALAAPHRSGQAKSWCWVWSLGLQRWAYPGSASLAVACAASSTFRGDLLVVLMDHGVRPQSQSRKPLLERILGFSTEQLRDGFWASTNPPNGPNRCARRQTGLTRSAKQTSNAPPLPKPLTPGAPTPLQAESNFLSVFP